MTHWEVIGAQNRKVIRMYFQDVLQTLNAFWLKQGCILWQPYHTEVGAGTSNPATFLRVLGPEPWNVAYAEPSTRPADGRYGENPNRLQHYYQYQVILKPSPPNVQDLFLQSFEALGLDLTKHDFRFVEDNWESPSLGAWGLGWEAWLDGMEVLQFTYFQECGGVKLDVRACELTYGVERIAMYLQGVENVYDLVWAPSGITYGDIYHASEVEYCHYNFEAADTAKLFNVFDIWESEGRRLLDQGLVFPAYDHCLRLSHLFNVLDARSALSVSERGRFLLRCRAIAERCAKGYFEQRTNMGFPLRRLANETTQEPVHAAPAPDPNAFKEMDDVLIEIGVEELPHNDVKEALAQTPALAEKLLDDAGLPHGDVTVHVSPRRIAVIVKDVPARQQDVLREMRGPKRAAAKTPDGEWAVAASKFAQANGATTEDIYFNDVSGVEYCFVKMHQKGRHISDLLPQVAMGLIKGLRFGKSMGWEDTTVTFSRPVRWLVALHGASAVPVAWKLREGNEIGAERYLDSGRVTYGHRRLAAGAIEIPNVSDYTRLLREHYVLADRDARMAFLRERVQKVCTELGLHASEEDEDVMDEICDITEWPEPILCEIPEEALVLPEEIIITPMKVHQRYIPLRTPDGKLSRNFLAVANGEHTEEGRAIIRQGNERVLNARLRDARYFWDTDTKHSLAFFAEKLTTVMFHQKLGTLADKVARIKNLYAALKPYLPKVNDAEMAQAIALMKADLATQMVFEFSSLEGIVGMLYARKEGLPEHIARAIFEHRLPRYSGDALPGDKLGAVAGLLDRLDTLAGYFGIGVRVKGTSDPFGLRRNALAVLSVIREHHIDAELDQLIGTAIEQYGALVADPAQTASDIATFFMDRLSAMTRDEGVVYDRVAAALASHGQRPLRFRACLDVLTALDEEKVQMIAEQAKRLVRIIKEKTDRVDPALLEDAEKALYAKCSERSQALQQWVARREFTQAFDELNVWAPVIAKYFEDVMVNAQDDTLRRNRHSLLQMTLDAIRTVADMTAIEKREV